MNRINVFIIVFLSFSYQSIAQYNDYNNEADLSLFQTIKTLFGINLQVTGGYNAYNYKWKSEIQDFVNPVYQYENEFYKQLDATGVITLRTPIINISQSFATRSIALNDIESKNVELTSIDFWGILSWSKYRFMKNNPKGDFLDYYTNNKPWKYWFLPRYDRIGFKNENSTFNRHSFLLYFISFQRENFSYIPDNLTINNINQNNAKVTINNQFAGFAMKPMFENMFSNIKALINLGYSASEFRNASIDAANDGSFGAKFNKLLLHGFPMINYESMRFKSTVSIHDSRDNLITTDLMSGHIGRAGIMSYGIYSFSKLNFYWIANFFFWGRNNLGFKNEVYESSKPLKRSTTDNYVRFFLSYNF